MFPLWQVIVKEFLQLRQDRRMIPAMIVGPVVQLLALGFAANLDVTDVRLLLVDQDRTSESRRLLRRFTASGYFELAGTVDGVHEVEPWLVSGRAQVALVIAAGYAREAASGGRPRVQLLADGSDANSAVVGLGYASAIVGQAGAELQSARLGGREGTGAGRIELIPRVWYNPDLRSRWFYVPAVLAMVLMLVTMIMPSMAIVREKELGTLEQISVTPLRAWQLVLGKLLPFVLIGLLDLFLITGLAVWIFGVPLRGSLVLLAALTLLFLLNTLGLGLFVSSQVRTQQQAMLFAAFGLMVPMIYLSGLIFPIENMPQPIQYVTYLIPVRYYAHVIRGIFLKGAGLDVLWTDAVVLAGLGAFLLSVAALRFRKSLD